MSFYIKDWQAGDLNALVKNLGEEVAVQIKNGKKIVVREGDELVLKDAIRPLFDKHDRRIPEGLLANVCDANRSFRLDQPVLAQKADYANRILRLHGCFSIDTGVTAEQLKAGTERLLAIIRENSQIANIVNGVYLPVVLPKLVTDNLGAELELYLAGVNKSYIRTFSDRKFYNRRKGTLTNEVSVVEGSRHDQLIERMKQELVIGLHFPNPLQGYSFNASREQMLTLPEGFILSGMDTPIAMAMYPDILARGWNTPGLNLAALQWQSADFSLSFRAYAVKLDFVGTAFLADARGSYSGGLLFLG